MKKLFLVLTAFLSLLCSCEKVEDPDLGSFQSWEPYLDMSHKNRFDESLFCKEWVVNKRYLETYVDGILQFKEDHTGDSTVYNYIFNGDYTMSYGTLTGSWLYSHNYLMWRLPIGIFSAAMEVQNVTSDVLTLKCEVLQSDSDIPFYKDKSGKHFFSILELEAFTDER